MIDKLDVRIPADTSFTESFQKLYVELGKLPPKQNPFHQTRHYLRVGDLRAYGYDAVLHLCCKWGDEANHKIELIDTGLRTYAGLVNEIESIFSMDGTKTGVMRLDLAVDVRGVPVSWFKRRMKANYKQFMTNFGSAQLVETGKGEIQTLYFGRRPNLFRIYDKIAEHKSQYQKALRQLKDADKTPDFREMFGVSETEVVTRIERQMGGKIPDQFSTVGQLKSLDGFSPFENLRIVVGGKPEPNPTDYGFEEFCTGMFLRTMADEDGMPSMMRFVTKHGNRNTRRILEKFRDFLPEEHPTKMLNSEYLNAIFRESISRQLAA